MNPQGTDQALVEASLQGDRDAFGRIVERYQGLICAVTLSATKDFGLSEDIAQETFLSAWRQLAQLREPEKLKSWLCGIARNLALALRRKQAHDPIHAACAIENPEAGSVASSCETPVERACSNQERALVERAVEHLPELYREPLVLFYRQECSIREVASALEISEDTARQRVSRARKMLRGEVAKIVEETLIRSRPSGHFAASVMAALPVASSVAGGAAKILGGGAAAAGGAAGTAALGSAGAAACKAGAAGAIGQGAAAGGLAQAAAPASILLWGLGILLGPASGAIGGALGIRLSLAAANSDDERRSMKRAAKNILGFIFGFTFILCGLMYLMQRLHPVSKMAALAFSAMLVVYAAVLLGLLRGNAKTISQKRGAESPIGGSDFDSDAIAAALQNTNPLRSLVHGMFGGIVFGSLCGLIYLEIAIGEYEAGFTALAGAAAICWAGARAVLQYPKRCTFAIGCLVLGAGAFILAAVNLRWNNALEIWFSEQGITQFEFNALALSLTVLIAAFYFLRNSRDRLTDNSPGNAP